MIENEIDFRVFCVSIYEARIGGDFLTLQITMQNLNNVCKSIKNWNADDI